MEFSTKTGSFEKQRSGCVVVGVFEGHKLSEVRRFLDSASGRYLTQVLKRGDLEARVGATLMLHHVPKIPAERVLLVSLGKERDFQEAPFRAGLAAAVRVLTHRSGAADATAMPTSPSSAGTPAWRDEQGRARDRPDGVYQLRPQHEEPAQRGQEARGAAQGDALHVAQKSEVAEGQSHHPGAPRRSFAGIALRQGLGQPPGQRLHALPTSPSRRSPSARRHGMRVEALERKQIEKLGMGAFLAVAQGSREPPRFIVIEHMGGKKDERPVALVGKGITFDTGGISIKPAAEMDEMKFDMCGAASVLGTMKAIAMMKLPLNVVGVIPSTENMPGGNAIKPGDIVTTMSGQTVEILNTDAEGRLILCDALTYVQKYKPAAVVDIATLTGAMVIALGHVATGLFANSDPLARELLQAGETAWDRAWHMPLWDEYQDQLKSNFADFPNIGSRAGGSVTAACFLSRFTKSYPWAHLDITGTAWKSGAEKGATGRPVAMLTHFLARRAAAAA